MNRSDQAQSFKAPRKREHMLILASGDRIRHMRLRPWTTALAGTAALALIAGYFSATAYLVMRDDLIGAASARQARLQHSYEDRIAALRAKVDSVTSRQILDQRLMEEQIARLASDQAKLDTRHGRLSTLLSSAEPGFDVPIPTRRPENLAALAGEETAEAKTSALDAIAMITGDGTNETPQSPTNDTPSILGYAPVKAAISTALPDDDALSEPVAENEHSDGIGPMTLRTIAERQIDQVTELTDEAFRTAETIEDALRDAGLTPPETSDQDDGGKGGPFIDASGVDQNTFMLKLDDLDAALLRLDAMRGHAARMPLGHPAEGKAVSSSFGKRRDPIIGRTAFHAGIDFRLRHGETVRSSGHGTVLTAKRKGGYGKMVEIDHGNGLVTRYAHLSAISVVEGQRIGRGDTVGKAGSTGRSTGPHLHYEVRRHDRPLDPARLIEAGKAIAPVFGERG